MGARLLVADLSLVTDIAAVLRTMGDAIAADVAIVGLTDELYTRRLAAVLALGALADTRAAGPLRAALQDRIAGVRAAALKALTALGPDAETAGECAELLSDSNAQVRIAAVQAVVRTAPHSSAGLAGLAGLAGDEDCLVRLEVARHVAGLPDRPAASLFADPDKTIRQAAALAAGPRQTDALAQLLAEDRSSDLRRAAARTLGSMNAELVANALVCGVEDPDAIVRAAVLHALERSLTRAGAVARLSRELVSGRPQRRRWSVYALAHLKAFEASREVRLLAGDPDPRCAAGGDSRGLGGVAEPDPLLLYMATDPDVAVQDSAKNWLARCRPTRHEENRIE